MPRTIETERQQERDALRAGAQHRPGTHPEDLGRVLLGGDHCPRMSILQPFRAIGDLLDPVLGQLPPPPVGRGGA